MVMSVQAITEVIARSYRDRDFVDAVRANPSAALEGYDLTEQERAALVSGDEDAIFGAAGLEVDAHLVFDEMGRRPARRFTAVSAVSPGA
jgi:hypothetical protein